MSSDVYRLRTVPVTTRTTACPHNTSIPFDRLIEGSLLKKMHSVKQSPTCPSVEWTTPADTEDIGCSASPTVTCSSNETSGCTHPKRRHNPGYVPDSIRLDTLGRRLKIK
ncbi:hypothetical protein RUM44_002557 [Polyplax serrata]|uniref:Uncharacterized protein n=1 Tax=Polyplax serrata TaxID=468196 RepID=A0ABR1AF50_POLSC